VAYFVWLGKRYDSVFCSGEVLAINCLYKMARWDESGGADWAWLYPIFLSRTVSSPTNSALVYEVGASGTLAHAPMGI